MRIVWTGIYPGHFDKLWEARRAKRQAIARREVLAKPEPTIVRLRDGRYLVRGALILGASFGWTNGTASGSPREVFVGTPVKQPRPKRRKNKRSPRAIVGAPRPGRRT
jgi:hypothetical protein